MLLPNADKETSSDRNKNKQQNTKHISVSGYEGVILQKQKRAYWLTERVLKAVSSATAIIAKSIAAITASNTKPTSLCRTSSVALPTAPTPVSSYDTQQSPITYSQNKTSSSAIAEKPRCRVG